MPRRLLPILLIVAALLALPVYDAVTPRGVVPSSGTRAGSFVPSKHGPAFVNRKGGVDAVTSAAVRAGVAGLCGGFSYAAVDYFIAGRVAPNDTANPVAPPTGEVGRYLARRHAASLYANGLRFLAWTLRPDADLLLMKGAGRATRENELPLLEHSLENGPVPLGLVASRNVADLKRSHQVVAFGVKRVGDIARIRLYDPNLPRADDVVLEVDLADASKPPVTRRGERVLKTWRGFFVERYVPETPPE